ncbi:MAG: hypothetical protein R3C30_15465 [Hyphomonadaceae bacterium]
MKTLRSIIPLIAPIYAFAGWAFSAVAGPYDNVLLAFSLAMIMAGTASGVAYCARVSARQRFPLEIFYYACLGLSTLTFIGGLVARALRVI